MCPLYGVGAAVLCSVTATRAAIAAFICPTCTFTAVLFAWATAPAMRTAVALQQESLSLSGSSRFDGNAFVAVVVVAIVVGSGRGEQVAEEARWRAASGGLVAPISVASGLYASSHGADGDASVCQLLPSVRVCPQYPLPRTT